MRFYAAVENGTSRIRMVYSTAKDAAPPEHQGRTWREIDRETYEELKNRDRRTTEAVWNPEDDEVLIRDRDQSVLEALAWQDLRAKRDRLLSDTDKTQLPDFPNGDLYVDYRQALRDLPQNTADPFNPVWPELPEAAQSYLKGTGTLHALVTAQDTKAFLR
jgi:hypothetical protein